MAGAMGGERRERKDARRNLERVLKAAHELFAERGADVTMEEVARRAGVGVGTVYRRFPSKEHLFAAVSQAACAEVQQCLHRAANTAPDPREKLRALVQQHYQRMAQQAALLELRATPDMQQCSLEGAAPPQLYAALHQLLQHIIAEGQQQDAMCEDDNAVLAALCIELLHPRTYYHLSLVIGGDAEAVAEQVARFMLRGLARQL